MKKLCIKCQQIKPVNEFHKDSCRPDGLFPYCKRCRHKNPEKFDEWKENQAKGLRHCNNCLQWLEPSEFYLNPSVPDGLHRQCKKCSIEQAKVYYHSDKDRAYQKNKNRYWNNKEAQQAKYKIWYDDNAERNRKRAKNWHKQNYYRVRDKRLAYVRQWYKKNGKDWRKKYSNSEKGRTILQLSIQKRRAKIKSANNTLTKEEWFEILKDQDYTCLACGKKFSHNLKPTMDHIIPVSKGGALTKENTQALCRSCNSKKSAKIIDYRQK